MNDAKKLPNIYRCKIFTNKIEWKWCKDKLNVIQKALENLLDEKRSTFPRFYFLSNDELLEIIAK